jgi:hypothetical protein
MSNFEVITNDLDHQEKKEIYFKIGKKAGYQMWDELTEENKKIAWRSNTNGCYHSYSVIKIADLPLLTFKRVGKGYKNELVVNLNSKKCTVKSPKQIELDVNDF